MINDIWIAPCFSPLLFDSFATSNAFQCLQESLCGSAMKCVTFSCTASTLSTSCPVWRRSPAVNGVYSSSSLAICTIPELVFRPRIQYVHRAMVRSSKWYTPIMNKQPRHSLSDRWTTPTTIQEISRRPIQQRTASTTPICVRLPFLCTNRPLTILSQLLWLAFLKVPRVLTAPGIGGITSHFQ